MNSETGALYDSKAAALAAGEREQDLVEMIGDPKAIRRVAGRVRMASRSAAYRRLAKRRMQRESRRKNRRGGGR